MKRIISVLLAAIMAVSVISCGGAGSNAETTAGSIETTAAPVETELTDNVPELDYNGATVTMFVRNENSAKPEFYVEDQTGDIVDDAIYNRNRSVEERLNINFEYVENPSNYDTRTSWPQLITQSILAGDAAYDIAAGYSMGMANLAAAGMLIDLQTTEYLDFTMPWWSDSLLNESLVNGKLFFASGDISTWMILYTYAMVFNKGMIEDYSLEDPYVLVDEGKWTIDKLIEMSSGIYEDLNGNSKKDAEDRFGYASANIYSDAFYYSAGLRTTDISSGSVKMSPLFSSEKAVDLVDKLTAFFNVGNDAYHVDVTNENSYNMDKGNTIFANVEIQYLYTVMRSVKFDYGIIPIPKYDENQEDYYTITSFPYTLYGIPLDAKDPDMASAVMECLASESYKNVSPALFEVALKVKYSQDSNDSRMYDIVKQSVVFDLGRVFNDSLGGKTFSLFRRAVQDANVNWATTCASEVPALEAQMDALFTKMGE